MREIGFLESAAQTRADFALREAVCGNFAQAREMALQARSASTSNRVRVRSALALAVAGDTSTAQTLASELAAANPSATLIQAVDVPMVRATMEFRRGNAQRTIELLESVRPYENHRIGAVYLRGLALLQLGKGREAAAEFQRIAQRRGFAIDILYPASHLGLPRAHANTGDAAQSRKAYQDFFALWRDADSDIPILKEARAEYARLK
jgi:hypothetical protein